MVSWPRPADHPYWDRMSLLHLIGTLSEEGEWAWQGWHDHVREHVKVRVAQGANHIRVDRPLSELNTKQLKWVTDRATRDGLDVLECLREGDKVPNTSPLELADDGTVLISGFLKPDGEWIEISYMGHRDWAYEECERLDIFPGLSEVDRLRERGYVQISIGVSFLLQDDMQHMKLTPPQLDFFLMNIDKLEEATKQVLTDYYDIVFPGVQPTPPPTRLIVPEAYTTSGKEEVE